MAKSVDLYHSGIGDVQEIMHNQGVSDLSWLAVDEEDYHAHEALPKQNLDIIPEFQKALQLEGDERVPALVPLRPHTIVNANPLDESYGHPSAAYNLVPARVARYVMAGLAPKVIAGRLQSEFSSEDLRAASHEANAIIAERGVLGPLYVDPKYLPRCAQPGSEDHKFATSVTKKALFVLASPRCTGCVSNCNGMCSALKKRIVSSIPYGPKLAASLTSRLASEGRPIDTSDASEQEWKERIRASFLQTPVALRDSDPKTIQTQYNQATPQVTKTDVDQFMTRRRSEAYLKYARQMMTGELSDMKVLVSAKEPEVHELIQEYGILGHTYLDMDALGGCESTLRFIGKTGCTPVFLLRRSATCGHCKDVCDGFCAKLRETAEIVHQKPELGIEHFTLALQKAREDGRINQDQFVAAANRVSKKLDHFTKSGMWASVIAAVNLRKSSSDVIKPSQKYAGGRVTLHSGEPGRDIALVASDEVLKINGIRSTISSLMNTGLRGKALQAAILQRYSRSDLSKVPEVGAQLSQYDGIQGQYFVDPAAYADCGKGCDVGASKFRKRGPEFVMACESCTGCTLQTAPAWCSKYSKNIIRQIPEEVQVAAKKRVLSVIDSTPVENPVEKYELASEIVVDIPKPSMSKPEISLSSHKVDE